MKIISWCRFLSFLVFLFPTLAAAQVTVVRVTDSSVYLDTSSLQRPVQKGETFKVILSTERLVNPNTGKDLGPLYTYSPAGKITEVQPLYAVGTIPNGAKISVGQEAVLEEIFAAPTAVTTNTAAPEEPASTRRKIVYAPVEQTIISLSQSPVLAEGAKNIVTLSDQGLVTVWTRAGETLQENGTYQLPAFRTPLSVSATLLSTPDIADVFVSYYDTRQDRISTSVLRYQENQFTEIDTLPYFVKERGCAQGKTVWAQKAFVSGIYPGNARELIYENGKFTTTDNQRATMRNWLTATNWASLEKEGAENFLYISSGGRVIAQLQNGKRAESKNLFTAAPTRLKYKQEIVKFYPSLQVFGTAENAVVTGVENTSKLGLLSATFGQYQNGKIHFMTYKKGRLNATDSVEMDGVVYDTACTPNTLLAAEVLPDGSSSVVEIFN